MDFLTQYDKQERFYSEPGSRIKDVFGLKVDQKTGEKKLVVIGQDNIYDKIQSFKDSVDIHVILKRFENGDMSALQAREGFYADVSDIPETYAGVLNLMQEANNYFDSLPLEVKKEFNNDFGQFLASLDKLEPKAEDSAAEVKTEAPVEEAKAE